jgi:CHAT domain-containing protein
MSVLVIFILASSIAPIWRHGFLQSSVWAQEAAPASAEPTGADRLLTEAHRLWTKALFDEDLVAAQNQCQEVLKTFQSSGDQRGQARALDELGLITLKRKQTAEALNHFDQALKTARAVSDRTLEAQILQHTGQAYAAAKKSTEALDAYQQSLALYRENKQQRGEAGTLIQLGRFQFESGQTDQALQSYQQASTMAQQLDDGELTAEAFDRLAWVYNELGDAQQALDLATQALFAHRQAGDQLGEGYALGLLGDLAHEAQQIDSALDFYQQALGLATAVQSPGLAWKMRARLAHIYGEQDQPDAARSAYESAMTIIHSVPFEAMQDPFERAVRFSQDEALRQYADFLLRSNPTPADIEKAFVLIEQARALTFLQVLTKSDGRGLDSIDPLKLEREHRLIQRLYDIRLTLRDPALTDADRQVQQQQWEQAKAEFDAFKTDIRAVQPRYAELRYPHAPSVKAIQQQLMNPGTVLLGYVLGQEQSHLFVMTNNSLTAYLLPQADLINQAIQSYRRFLTDPGREPSADPAPVMALGRQLYDTLIRPAETFLKQKNRLLIVPDGWLCYLPFEALIEDIRNPQTAVPDPTYLLESHTISYSPSADVWQRLRGQRFNPAADRLLLVYGDATSTSGLLTEQGISAPSMIDLEREARAIGQALGGQYADIRLRRRAEDPSMTRPELSHYRLVHLAVPCVLNEREPWQSEIQLVLGDGEPHGQRLTLAEILRQPIGVQLMMLNHCQPQFGERVSGNGLMGLTRGLFYAGTSSVIVSVWDGEDASTDVFMQAFYQQLRAGQSASAALRAAKLQLLRTASYRDPRHWARWMVMGDGERTIQVSSLAQRVVLWSGALMAAALMVLGVYLTQMRRES